MGASNNADIFVDWIEYLKEENIGEVLDWFAQYGDSPLIHYHTVQNEYYVAALDGVHMLSKGDFIVRDMDGHYHVFGPEKVFWHSSIRR